MALQDERRKLEIEKDRLVSERRKAAEQERLKIKDEIELDRRLQERREELRLHKQKEAQDRKWREQELKKVKRKNLANDFE